MLQYFSHRHAKRSSSFYTNYCRRDGVDTQTGLKKSHRPLHEKVMQRPQSQVVEAHGSRWDFSWSGLPT